MEIIGYAAAVLIGISLGLIGGGGSILTVPVLIYLMGLNAVTSTSFSLFVVGATALVGAYRNYIKGNLELKLGLIFAIPSLMAVWFSRAIIIPAIPAEVTVGGAVWSKDIMIMVFFALIMMVSSYSMIRSGSGIEDHSAEKRSTKDNLLIVLEGMVVGLVTGIIGAGGGFLIIPALVLLAKLPMKKAVGTSLMIIAIKSLIGFTGDLTNPEIEMNWTLLGIFTAMSIIGIFIGIRMATVISGAQLKKGFGWFLLVMGIYILSERLMQLT